MLQDINEYLSTVVSDERRALVVELYRTLEAILGGAIYFSVGTLLSEEGEPSAIATELDEYALGLLARAFGTVGVQLDPDELDARDFGTYTQALQTLFSIENHEDLGTFSGIIDATTDSVESLSEILVYITPELTDKLDWIAAVSPALLRQIRNVSRAAVIPEAGNLPEGYGERVKEFVSKHGSATIVQRFLEDGVNLAVAPELTIKFLLAAMEPTDPGFPHAHIELLYRSTEPDVSTFREKSTALLTASDIEPHSFNTIEELVMHFLE